MDAKTLNQGHFDRESPLSLYNKMGERWANRFIEKLSEAPELAELLCDETVLKPKLQELYKFRPTASDNKYRLQLWLEYENSVKLERQMNMANVYNLVGPESSFHTLVMKDSARVAWLLCKPISYDSQMREILDTGMHRMRAILELDYMTSGKGGGMNLPLMKLQLDITRMMDLRQHGAPTQKIQSLALQGTIGANGEIQGIGDSMDMKALEERKKDLHKRRLKAEGRAAAARAAEPEPIDVEVVKDGDVVQGPA